MDELRCQHPDGCDAAARVGRLCPRHAVAQYVRTTVRGNLPDRYRPAERVMCSVTTCTRQAAPSGLCGRHARQQERRGRVTTLPHSRPPGASQLRDDEGRKECGMCLRWLPVDEYSSSRQYPDGLNPYCTTCVTATRFGLSQEELTALREASGGRCTLCGELNVSGRHLAVDHDHACCPGSRSCGRCVRNLLCGKCNTGLGMFKDSPELLGKAIAYLEKYATKDFRVEATVPANGAVPPSP